MTYNTKGFLPNTAQKQQQRKSTRWGWMGVGGLVIMIKVFFQTQQRSSSKGAGGCNGVEKLWTTAKGQMRRNNSIRDTSSENIDLQVLASKHVHEHPGVLEVLRRLSLYRRHLAASGFSPRHCFTTRRSNVAAS